METMSRDEAMSLVKWGEWRGVLDRMKQRTEKGKPSKVARRAMFTAQAMVARQPDAVRNAMMEYACGSDGFNINEWVKWRIDKASAIDGTIRSIADAAMWLDRDVPMSGILIDSIAAPYARATGMKGDRAKRMRVLVQHMSSDEREVIHDMCDIALFSNYEKLFSHIVKSHDVYLNGSAPMSRAADQFAGAALDFGDAIKRDIGPILRNLHT